MKGDSVKKAQKGNFKKQNTQIDGKRIEFEELKIECLLIQLKRFGAAFQLNNGQHVGIYFNDNTQIILDSFLMLFQYTQRTFKINDKEQNKTLNRSQSMTIIPS